MRKIVFGLVLVCIILCLLVGCKDSSNTKKLLFIDVTLSPTDYVFSEGDIVKEHLIVKGLYSDGSEKTLSKESYSTNLTDDKVTSTTNKVTVTYQSKTKTIPISVRTDSKTLLFIDVTVTPTDYVFSDGESIKPHLIVKGYYSDGTVETITDYSTDLTDDKVTSTTDKVTVTYQSKTKTIPISVSGSGIILKYIEVTKDTNIFNVGEDIKPHLTVKGIYSDGDKIISKEGYSTNLENDKITSTTNSVTISYTDCGVTKTKNIPITVYLLTSIEVEKRTNFFFEGENIKDLIIVKGHYTDGSEKTITDTDYSTNLTDDKITSTTNKVEISYTENGVTKKESITITVTNNTSNYVIKSNWFDDKFRGEIDKNSVTSISFLKKEPKDLTNLDGLSYFRSGTDLYVVGRQLIFDSNCRFMFEGFHYVTEINLTDVNTSKVTDMMCMFSGCSQLTSLNLSNFDTSNVTDMSNMFRGCSQLTSLNLSNFDTTKVTYKDDMFENCGKRGTTVTINPTYVSFFNGTELGNTDVWTYSSPIFTHRIS